MAASSVRLTDQSCGADPWLTSAQSRAKPRIPLQPKQKVATEHSLLATTFRTCLAPKPSAPLRAAALRSVTPLSEMFEIYCDALRAAAFWSGEGDNLRHGDVPKEMFQREHVKHLTKLKCSGNDVVVARLHDKIKQDLAGFLEALSQGIPDWEQTDELAKSLQSLTGFGGAARGAYLANEIQAALWRSNPDVTSLLQDQLLSAQNPLWHYVAALRLVGAKALHSVNDNPNYYFCAGKVGRRLMVMAELLLQPFHVILSKQPQVPCPMSRLMAAHRLPANAEAFACFTDIIELKISDLDLEGPDDLPSFTRHPPTGLQKPIARRWYGSSREELAVYWMHHAQWFFCEADDSK